MRELKKKKIKKRPDYTAELSYKTVVLKKNHDDDDGIFVMDPPPPKKKFC